jgi:hypothetical protein
LALESDYVASKLQVHRFYLFCSQFSEIKLSSGFHQVLDALQCL